MAFVESGSRRQRKTQTSRPSDTAELLYERLTWLVHQRMVLRSRLASRRQAPTRRGSIGPSPQLRGRNERIRMSGGSKRKHHGDLQSLWDLRQRTSSRTHRTGVPTINTYRRRSSARGAQHRPALPGRGQVRGSATSGGPRPAPAASHQRVNLVGLPAAFGCVQDQGAYGVQRQLCRGSAGPKAVASMHPERLVKPCSWPYSGHALTSA